MTPNVSNDFYLLLMVIYVSEGSIEVIWSNLSHEVTKYALLMHSAENEVGYLAFFVVNSATDLLFDL